MSVVTRLVAVVAVVAAVAVLVSGLIVRELAAESTIDEVQRILDDQRTTADQLLEAAAKEGSWEKIEPVADELAAETGLRVVVTDVDGRVLIDSERDLDPDDRTPLSDDVVQVLDPSTFFFVEGDLQGVGVAVEGSFDEAEFVAALISCLEASGAPFVVETDVFGAVFPIVEDPLVEEACANEVIFGVEGADFLEPFVVAEPALLYLGYSGVNAFESADEGIGTGVVVTMLVVAAAAGAVMWWWGRRTLQPVGEVAAAARSMGDGDLAVRVDPDAPGELGELAGAFNEMAAGLAGEDERRRRLTSDIAHELRNPLANVSGYLDAVADGVMEPDDELLGILREETDHLGHLVDDLQTLTLAEAGELHFATEIVDVGDVVRSTQSVHSVRAEQADIELRVTGDAPVLVRADIARLRQVVGNLVENAIRYSDGGSVVELDWRRVDDLAVVEVRDQGVGISDADQKLIFQRFHRVDESRNRATGGAGLGLSIARRFVEAMGGTLSVRSELGAGSTFSVSLPAVARTASSPSEGPQ